MIIAYFKGCRTPLGGGWVAFWEWVAGLGGGAPPGGYAGAEGAGKFFLAVTFFFFDVKKPKAKIISTIQL